MPLAHPPNANVLSQFSLKGKVAAVTGGARGIGLEVVRGLAEAGADVAMLYTTSSNAPQVAEEVAKETGQKIQAYQADVRNVESITVAINQVASDFGHLDIIVANAGVTLEKDALEVSADEFRNVMAVNVDGAFYAVQAAGNIFKKQGSGNAIFTSSVSAHLVNLPQKQAVYNASKAAVTQLAKCLAVEWTEFARVNVISPGFIATDSKYMEIVECA
jgi:sorbose reductase